MEPLNPAPEKRQIHLGQEAVDGFEGSEPLLAEVTNTETAHPAETPNPAPTDTKPPTRVSTTPGAINKPLMECYPEIADDENEQLLADVRRHWLGRVSIFIGGGILILLLFLFTVTSPSLLRGAGFNADASTKGAIGLGAIIVGALIGLGTFVMLWIYNQNHMLITNENVIEVRQVNLFTRKVSHLNMINVEDVTVLKKGIFQTAFNYGTISIETAGEKDNFTFIYTPSPDIYRRMVINAHEDAIEHIGRMGPIQRVEISDNGL
jgi:hypothetical protein